VKVSLLVFDLSLLPVLLFLSTVPLLGFYDVSSVSDLGMPEREKPPWVFSTELNGAYSIGIKDEEGTCLWSQERGNIKYMAPACP
jgi:hypothetical protein